MRILEYTADESRSGMEAGIFLRAEGYSRAMLTLLKQTDGLHINGRSARTIDKVSTGDKITVIFKDVSGAVPNASLKADIVYDDEDVVVFDKPAGMAVHTSLGHNDDTLANLFAALYPDSYFHAVSRLDRNTSGLIIAAKHKFAAARLMTDPAYRQEKLYYAVTDIGLIDSYGDSGEIIAPIARENDSIIRRVVREDGVFAHTKYRVIYSDDRHCMSEISLVTGRTHQIRVHFAHIGFPLAGDELYGGDTGCIGRQALHCGRLKFRQPVTGDNISLFSPIPDDISGIFKTKPVLVCNQP